MAGDWIKFEVGTPDKPEVWAIAAALGIDPDAVVGKLLRVWAWFDQHTENGNAPSVSKMLLDRLVGVTGFCNATIEAGWMADANGVLSISNFDRHNGKTAKTRALTAKRVNNHKNKSNAKGNAGGVSDSLPREDKREDTDITDPNGSVGGTKVPPCPHQTIIALYHERLPTGTQVREWGPTRQKHLQARWREETRRQSLDWWSKFFDYCAESEFLTGRAAPQPGRDPFVVSLDWLVSPQNFAKVVEGKYHRRAA